MIKAYLVEDELYAREDLKDLLRQSNNIQVVGEADEIQKAMWEIHQFHPEVVFLDIHLTNGNGLDLAKQLSSLKTPPFIVFVTAFAEYAVKAFELEAIDYILKPFDETRLDLTIAKIVKWHMLKKEKNQLELENPINPNKDIKRLAVVRDERITLLDVEKIMYIGTENRQVFVKTENDKYEIDTHLYEIEEKLLKYSFIRVHRGYIINLEYVDEVEQWFNGTYNLVFRDKSKVPVSRSYAKTVRKYLGF